MRLVNSLIIFILLFFIGCSSSSKYTTDWDPEVNFSQYKSFKIYQGKKPDGDALRKNRLAEKRVERAIENNLTSKGYDQHKGEVDFVIIVHAGTQEKANFSTSVGVGGGGYGYGGYGYGGYGRGWGGYGGGVTTVHSSTHATLYIDVVDYATKDLAWRGTGSEVIYEYSDREEMEQFIDEVVTDILNDFPPGKE